MKAKDSIPRYTPKLREYANYTRRRIIEFCRDIGPRPSGEEAEKRAQERIAAELEGYADTVSVEPFSLHPKAFLGWVRLCAILMIIGNALFAVMGWAVVSLAVSALCLFFIITEFLFYGQTLDPFFPKRESRNVVGVRNPSGEVKRRIIVSGHVDSSYEWRYTYLGGPHLITAVIGSAAVGIIISLATSIVSVVQGHVMDAGSILTPQEDSIPRLILRIIILAWCILYIAAIFFLNYKKPVDGANDNLTGTFAAMSVMKFLSDNDIRFENTEVRTVITGSEEAGLRGAKAYAKAHKQECKDVETVFIGADTLRDYEFIAIYNRDMTYTVKADPRVCALLKKASETAGLDLPFKGVFLGASDAAAISKAGIPAASLCAMDPAPARYYHTRLDTSDNLNLKTIEAGINVLLESVFLYDEQGLTDSYTE